MSLTDTKIRGLKARDKDYKAYDAKGLFLQIKKSASKKWRLKFHIGVKEKLITLGSYPEMSLKEARQQREEILKLVEQGIDPVANRKAKHSASPEEKTDNRFVTTANEWFEVKISTQSESHKARTLRLLEKELYPQIGHLPITDITPPILLQALRKIENRGVIDTAHRAKQVAGLVFRYAIASGRAERDPSADLSGVLRTHTTTHYAAPTDPKAVGTLYRDIQHYSGSLSIRNALRLTPLLMCRPGELRQLEWSEVCFDDALIEIPAEKMKMRSSHIIPLSTQAMTILKEMHPYSGHLQYVFPSNRSKTICISNNSVRTALRTMGYSNGQITPHGFRAMARTLLDEVLNYPVEWIEQQLAHSVKDPLGRAYNRTKHLSQRREMMQGWADYLDGLIGRTE